LLIFARESFSVKKVFVPDAAITELDDTLILIASNRVKAISPDLRKSGEFIWLLF
jgi:hypothetical protein